MAMLIALAWPSWGAAQAPLPADVLLQAELAYKDARFHEAERLYNAAATRHPTDPSALLGRAMCREMLGLNEKAVEDYKKVLQLDATNYKAMENLARLYEGSGTHDKEAAELFRRALELDPRPEWKENLAVWAAMMENRLAPQADSAVGCWHKGHELAAKGDHKGAELYFARTIELNPGMFQAYLSRGLLRLHRGNLEEAVADLDQAIKLAPDLAMGVMYRGLAKEQIGLTSQANQDALQAARMDPKNPSILLNLGNMLEHQGDPRSALRVYTDALKLNPPRDIKKALQERVAALASLGRSDNGAGTVPRTGGSASEDQR